jgi:phage protein D/phage baseplate assembly protein gpV
VPDDDESVAGFEVKIAGNALAAALLEDLYLVTVEESVALASTFALHFYDPGFVHYDAAAVAVGAEVDIAFGWGNSLTTVMHGEVTGVSLDAKENGDCEFTVVGLDKMHRAMRGSKSETFQNMTDADIAKKIASAAGLTPDVDDTGSPHPYLFQINESDHQWLRNRARRIGFNYWVSDQKLHFKKRERPASNVTATWGENLYRFKGRMSSTNYANEVQVRSWDEGEGKAIVGKATANDVEPTDATFYSGFLTDSTSKFASKTRITSQYPAQTQTEADNIAKSLRYRMSTAGLLVRGEMEGDPDVAAGKTIKLAGLGTKLSGSYLLTNVEHSFGALRAYITRFVSSGPDGARLPDLLGSLVDCAGQPAAGTTLMMGVVTNLKDPDSLGRVKVKLPELSDTDETFWARVVMPGAGGSRGFQTMPSVNDEVLVAFEAGDPRRALIIGGMWGKKYKPPETEFQKEGKVEKQFWRSAKGHGLKIDDAEDGTIALTLKGNKSQVSITKADTHIEGETKVSVKATDIEITASGKLTLKGNQIEINGSSDVTVKGGMIKLN